MAIWINVYNVIKTLQDPYLNMKVEEQEEIQASRAK